MSARLRYLEPMTGTGRRIRFGVLGAGRIVQNRVGPALHAAGNATFDGAASRDPARARALSPDRVYASYDALIADPDIDAVYIGAHNGLHRDLTLAALASGKHVLCEKPLGRNAAECEEMIAAAAAADRHLVEAFMYRHHPQLARVQQLVQDGAIGPVQSVEASFRFRLTREHDVRWRSEWGGGALLDVGCYCVNASRLFLGGASVRARALAAYHPTHGVDVSVQGALGFPDGRVATISCGFDGGLHQQVTLIGTGGMIRLEEPFIARTDAPSITVQGADRDARIVSERVNTYMLEIEDLARAILSGGRPLLPASDALENARALDLLAAVARDGR